MNGTLEVPIEVIQKSVSLITDVSIKDMKLTSRDPLSRKGEVVNARQVSMTLTKYFTGMSLATIGKHHGDHDHATVLHAKRTVEALLDTKDHRMVRWFNDSKQLLDNWVEENKPKIKKVKLEIKQERKIPQFVGERILQPAGARCPICKHQLNNHVHNIKTISNSL